MLAYHNDPEIKVAILNQLREHQAADALVQGYGYWDDGKGCAVGCTLHSSNHAEYEPRFGVPQMLAHLEDRIFEGLPAEIAREWPLRFMGAVEVGTDLSRVGWKFLHWLLTDETVNPGINHPLVKSEVAAVAKIMNDLGSGAASAESAAWSAAESAAWSAAESAAESAAWSAARSAESAAESAAWSAAESAARSAESAAWSAARSAESAARSAESAAWSAAESAAWSAAESAAYIKMADKLISLIEAA